MTYDLRRMRRKGFIARELASHRYRLTPQGRRLALFFTKSLRAAMWCGSAGSRWARAGATTRV
jgi:hypothetical protein